MLEIEQHSRVIEAVQITDENIAEVARWINPHFQVLILPGGKKRIMVPHKVKGQPQKDSAFVGDWVVNFSNGNFRRYSDKNYRLAFPSHDGDYQELLHNVRLVLNDRFGFDQSYAEEIIDALRERGIAFREI